MSRIRSLWNEVRVYEGGTMFQSFAWNETAARVFRSRERPHIVVGASDAGLAIIPASVVETEVRLIGETLFDYRDVLSTDELLIEAGLAELAKLEKVFSVTAIRGQIGTKRWQGLTLEPFARAPGVWKKDVTSEEFLSSQRRLGRHSRRIRKHGIDLREYPGSNRDLVRLIYEKKGGQGSTAENLFADSLRREFMAEICSHPEVCCDIYTYETSCDLVAALVTFRDGETRRFYTVYFDRRWAELSPGQVLLFEITAKSLGEGLDCDYMTGEYPYKMRLATDGVPLYRVTASPKQLRDAASSGVVPVRMAA
jgi:CelD/BcsL family acetyltransferase involved in cellulose biosynthesis